MKKIMLMLCVAVFALASCNQAKKKVFELGVQQFNQQCPMNLDAYTRADSATYLSKTDVVQYYYSLLGQADDKAVADQTKVSLESTMPATIKAMEELKPYREAGITFEYIYKSDKTKDEYFRVKVTPDMYK